jgi:hypothetical protein
MFRVALAAFLWLIATLSAQADVRLMMVEQTGCYWCAEWRKTIGPIYGKTPEGQAAPLFEVNLRDPALKGFDLTSQPLFTPTFILVDGLKEIGRIEGYPGEDFFWGLLAKQLSEYPASGFKLEDATAIASDPATQ